MAPTMQALPVRRPTRRIAHSCPELESTMQRCADRFAMILVVITALSGCAHGGGQGQRLLDTDWVLMEMDGKAPPATAADRHPELRLDSASARAEGSGGCNRFAADFKQTAGAALSFGAPAASKMGCTPAINQLERDFFGALQTVAAQRIEGDRLQLLDAQGRVVLSLQVKQ